MQNNLKKPVLTPILTLLKIIIHINYPRNYLFCIRVGESCEG